MTSKRVILVLFTVWVLCLMKGVEGQINCYQCNSFIHGRSCLSPIFPNVSSISCPNGYMCSTVTYVTQNIFVTSRNCDPGSTRACDNIRGQLQTLYPDLASFTCHTCRTSYCNSANGLQILTAFTIIVSALLTKLV